MQGNVQSIDTIRNLKIGVDEFATALGNVAFDLSSEVTRALQWIQIEAPAYWREQLRLAEQRLSEALDNLASLEQTYGGRDKPAATEAKKRVSVLKKRAQTCQQKLLDIKKWAAEIEHGSNLMSATTANLQQQSESVLPLAEARLEAWIRSLDNYASA
jgi:cysteinyl-tRNA synthetase